MQNDTIRNRRERSPSGRFVVRIDPSLHAALRANARSEGVSLNRYCARKLGSPGSELPQPASDVVDRAFSILGESLSGVVVFGSWARGAPSWESDLDVLVIAADRLPISRGLYRHWDEGPELEWDGHAVEPHFVHLPAEDRTPTGLWAEVAMDGLVLFERGLAVSRRLAGIRRRILEKRISHRVVHGNSYWVRGS